MRQIVEYFAHGWTLIYLMALDEASTRLDPARDFDVARLVRDHQAGLWRYLRVLGCTASQAEDLTQETFLAVLQKPFQEFSTRATAAYLRQVARNLFISSRRRAK